MLWQLWCHCNPDHDKFSSTVVAIFPNVCLWRRSLCSNLVLTLKNCIEPPSYASTAYVVAIWPSFIFDSFVKIGTVAKIFWANGLPPLPLSPAKKFPYAYVFIASSSRKRYWNWTLPWIKAQIGLSSTFVYGYRMSTDSISARNSQVSQGAGETTTELWRKESREFSELYIYTRIVFFAIIVFCIVI